MALVTDILDWLRALPPAGVTAGAGLLVFGECTLGLGFIAPGESGLFILGTTVDSTPKFLLMWLVTTICAIGGDSVGYLLGKKFGPRLRQTKLVQKHGADGWDKACDFLRRKGSWAVLIAIFLPVMRTLVPAAAGASGLPFRKFLPPVAVGATAWCALHIGIGAAAGEAAEQLESAVGKGSWVILALIAAAFVAFILLKRKRAATNPTTDNPTTTGTATTNGATATGTATTNGATATGTATTNGATATGTATTNGATATTTNDTIATGTATTNGATATGTSRSEAAPSATATTGTATTANGITGTNGSTPTGTTATSNTAAPNHTAATAGASATRRDTDPPQP